MLINMAAIAFTQPIDSMFTIHFPYYTKFLYFIIVRILINIFTNTSLHILRLSRRIGLLGRIMEV